MTDPGPGGSLPPAGVLDGRVSSSDEVPALTADQWREMDPLMVEELHIDLPRLVEDVRRSLADSVLARFAPATVTVLAGPGGNGGGIAAARHEADRRVAVAVVFSRPDASAR